MLYALLLIPLAAAFLSWFIPADMPRRVLLVTVSSAVLGLAVACWFVTPAPALFGLLSLDPAGRLVLTATSVLFFAASVYGLAYLKAEETGVRRDFQQGLHFSNAPEATFTACLLLFLFASVLVACTRHFGLLWVGIETTTIVSAPLIYFHRHQRSLEATWKYLLICSVGIALALIGNLLLDISMQNDGGVASGMDVDSLKAASGWAHPVWFKAAFVFLLIGYGTKMGIAPMHTWLPDAHSESPSLVSALLSGSLLNCAFLGIFRVYEVGGAVGMTEFMAPLVMAFGFLSMLIAALFIVGLGDYKRMLAYSSVEHMGILLIALGVGGQALTGGMLHLMSHSFVKAALFLLAGNILAKYHTKSSHDVTGMGRVMPLTAGLWLAGVIAITGSPPFSLFVSEFRILFGLVGGGNFPLAALFLLLLGIIFAGMITPVLRMCKGKPPHGVTASSKENYLLVLPSACLLGIVLCLGLYSPEWFARALGEAAALIARP